MDSSPIARLPAELRGHIAEFALRHQDPLLVQQRMSPRSIRKQSTYTIHTHPLALAQTCHLLRNECTVLFYSANSFLITGRDTDALFRGLEDFCSTIGKQNEAALTSIILDIGTLDLESFEAACSSYNELQRFMKRMAIESRSGVRRYTFRARIIFTFRPFASDRGTFTLDLDFSKIESSWDANMEAIRSQIAAEDADYWQRVAPMLRDAREALLPILRSEDVS